MSETIIKSSIAGITVALLDIYALNEPILQNSIILGVTTASGIYAGDIVGKLLPDNLKTSLFDGKTVETRVLEVAGTAGFAYGASKLAGREILQYNFINKLGIIVASDVIGSYATDFLMGKPLTFLE